MTIPVENPVKVLERHIKLQQQQQQHQTADIEAELVHNEVPPHIQEVLSPETSDSQNDSD